MANPATTPTTDREQWSHQTGFIIAAIGSAVGLGNIWRFPGVAYESGGGAFIVPYLIALLTAGIPILFLDYALGHRYRGAPPLALRRMRRWSESLGWFQVLISFVIAVYYAAVVAWSLSYIWFSLDMRYADDPKNFFVSEYLQVGDPAIISPIVPGVAIPVVIVWLAVLVVLALGVASGLEKTNMIFIPLLVIAFGALVVRAITLPGATDGLDALFTPQWGALTNPGVWIAAYSQIFFSLSVAFGIMITYSSYQRRKANMTTSGLVVAFANSSFEILAGIGVFATLGFLAHQQSVQVSQLEGLTGPILSFVTFPTVLAQMPGGPLWGVLFFASLLMAGFTSLVSILQVVAGGIQDKFGVSRRAAAVGVAIVCGLISVALFSTASGLNALDTVDQWVNNLGIVTSAIIMTIIVVWVARCSDELRYHLNTVSTFKVGRWWIFLVGILAPIVLLVMLVNRIIALITEGYEGYPGWYLGVFGWGMMAFMVVAALILTAMPWRRHKHDFIPWPPYPADSAPQRAAAGHDTGRTGAGGPEADRTGTTRTTDQEGNR